MDGDPGSYRFLDSLVTEKDLQKHASSSESKFLYFVVDGNAVFAALCPAGATGDIYVIQRSLSCRRAFQFSCQKKVAETKPTVVVQPLVDETDEKSDTKKSPSFLVADYADEADWDFVAFRNSIPGYNKIEKCIA